jgi:hypothetical protein
MTDRELLELAAKAAGLDIQRNRLNDPACRDFLMNGDSVRNPGQLAYPWNPLADDGDALRLAVNLHICISVWRDGSPSAAIPSTGREFAVQGVTCPYEAARRAIVRAAAEIGRTMK